MMFIEILSARAPTPMRRNKFTVYIQSSHKIIIIMRFWYCQISESAMTWQMLMWEDTPSIVIDSLLYYPADYAK